jgi:hypothetical protein
MLRSWLASKLRVLPSQPILWGTVRTISWDELRQMYLDSSDRYLDAWAKANDTRVRRALIDTGGPELVKVGDTQPIKRPKLT